MPIAQGAIIVHNLLAIDINVQRPLAGVGKVGLDLDVIILATLNRIGVGPERHHLEVAGRVAGIDARRSISGNNLQMLAIEFDCERR